MVHQDTYRNGVKLVSATEIPSLVAKPFLDKWRIKLCHCQTHFQAKKTAFKSAEKAALERFGIGHCGFVYADQVKDNAGDLGNEVHDIIENWFTTGTLKEGTTEAVGWASKITQLYKAHSVTPAVIKPEGLLVDEESGLCGSPDTIAEWDGRVEILDTKIKNQLDDLTAMQGCAYRYLIRRLYDVDIRYMRAIWCEKESKDKVVTPVLFDLDEWTEAWKGLILVWNKTHKKRQINIRPAISEDYA